MELEGLAQQIVCASLGKRIQSMEDIRKAHAGHAWHVQNKIAIQLYLPAHARNQKISLQFEEKDKAFEMAQEEFANVAQVEGSNDFI